MKISSAKDVIKDLYKTNSVTALISERGVGKTSVYKQCAMELGIGYIDLYASALDGPDFMGLPVRDSERGITDYLPPRFLPTVEAVEKGIYPKAGLLIIEEINRVSGDAISVLYPLLLDRRINGHNLAPDWKIGVTMNPDNSNYLVNSMDDAMLDRFISLWIDPDLEDYIEFSKKNIYNKRVISFLNSFPDMLLVVDNNSSPLEKSPTPRGWSQVQDILTSSNLENEILQEVVSGIVGSTASASLFSFIKNSSDELPSAKDILSDFPSMDEKIGELIKSGRIDLLINITDSIISNLHGDRDEVTQLNSYLNKLPQEALIYFYKELTVRKPDILSKISDFLDTFDEIADKIIDLMVG